MLMLGKYEEDYNIKSKAVFFFLNKLLLLVNYIF